MEKESNYIKNIKSCPHCGSTFGYYQKMYVSGWIQDNTLFDGELYNNEMFDSLKYSRESKYFYCYECNKKLARTS